MQWETLELELAALGQAAAAWLSGLPEGWRLALPLLLAAALGAAVCALLWLRPLRRIVRRLRHELRDARDAAARLEEARAALDREAAELSARTERLGAAEAEAERLRGRLEAEIETRAALASQLETERRSHAARVEELQRLEGEVETKFAALANDALGANAERFLALVSERFAQHKSAAEKDLTARKTEIEGLLTPVREQLGRFEVSVGEIEKARAGAYAQLSEQIRTLQDGNRSLGDETRRLVQALRAPKTRGRWGEMQLKRVFEMAGMLENVDFFPEKSLETDAGLRRPDAVVRLPGGKSVVIDAKTPLEGYLNALETADPAAQETGLSDHARQLKAHVKGLASKEYWAALPEAPDFVVMFVPGEAFYAAAVERDPSLIETAFESRVLVCSPTTLIALIKSIAYGWQQERLAEDAQKAADASRELYERLKTFGGHLDAVGRGLKTAVTHYNKAVSSMESRVLPSARKIEGLSVLAEGGDRVADPTRVEDQPQALSAQEFAGSGVQAAE
ncbi:MAG: DNA recombination protein RmuC [Pseudomonadota bacterium]